MSGRSLTVIFVCALLSAPGIALALPPPVDALLTPQGHTVTIKRDAFGVPHIYADDPYALFWGNGYAQAQDRLFQMDVLRHVGKGESARYLGPSQLAMDLETRRELYTDAERAATFLELSPEHQRMFRGFSDGVNAWIAKTRADPMLLSAEFYALGHAPEDWVPEDTIALAQFLLDIFGAGSGGNELANAKLYAHMVETIGETEARKAFADLFWMHDAGTFTTVKVADGTYAPTEGPMAWEAIPEWQWELVASAARAQPFGDGSLASLQETAAAHGLPSKFGSNALVVGPSLSHNGGAMLIGGPQMAYYNPMIPYEVALHGAGFDALGMGVGGAPGVIIGRTKDMAWTVTSGSSDQVDVVAVKLAGPRSYYVSGTSGATKDMDCRVETHFGHPTAIDQKPPVLAVQEVCRTDAGPVFAIDHEGGYAFSRMRTHRLDEVRSGALWLTISQAQDMDSFAAHMETFRFEFNFHVADSSGNIGYYHFGANPDRSEDCDPRFPRLAGLCDWTAIRTGSQLPHVKNPSDDYIVNWNNKPALGWSGGDAIEKWGPRNRAQLIEDAVQDELALDGSLTMSDLHRINERISTRTPYASGFVPALLAATDGLQWHEVCANPPCPEEAAIGRLRTALADWAASGYVWDAEGATCKIARSPNACFGTHSAGFTAYEEWRTRVQLAVFADEMGEHTRKMGFVPELSSDPHAADHGREDNKDNTLYNALHGTTAHAWCDVASTPATETCDDVFRAAFVSMLEDGWDGTQKAPMHTIKFAGLSGGPSWRIPMVNRPSFNHYYDFGTGDAGSNLPPGTDQTWFPTDFLRFSADGTMPDAHKDDQLKLYVDFQYKPAQMVPIGGPAAEVFVVGETGLLI